VGNWLAGVWVGRHRNGGFRALAAQLPSDYLTSFSRAGMGMAMGMGGYGGNGDTCQIWLFDSAVLVTSVSLPCGLRDLRHTFWHGAHVQVTLTLVDFCAYDVFGFSLPVASAGQVCRGCGGIVYLRTFMRTFEVASDAPEQGDGPLYTPSFPPPPPPPIWDM
jgi:hypothetical protein